MNYQSALRILQTARNIDNGKPIDRNTRLMQRGDNVVVLLHSTDIVTFSPNGDVTLDSGGWRTKTTSERMHRFSPHSVSSNRGTWFVRGVPFADGMTIHASGEVTGGGDPDAFRKNEAIKRSAANYASRFVSALYRGEIGAPSSGDCMMCSGRMGGDHIESHIEESYYVPSLLVNALNEFGASQAARHDAQALMMKPRPIKTLVNALEYEPFNGLYCKDSAGFIAKQIAKCIRRYTLRRMGVAT